MLQKIEQVGFEPHQDRLRFRVAESAVEFQGARVAVSVDHHPRVEESPIGNTIGGHAVHCRHDDLAHDARVHRGRDRGCGRVRTHAAGVRALVAVLQTLVILRRREGEDIPAIDHDDEARFLADETFLDHHARAGVAETVADEHLVDGAVRLCLRRRHDDAFAGGEPIGLDHDRRAARAHVVVRSDGVCKALILGGGNAVARHERLSEILGALQSRRGLRRAEDPEAGVAKGVDYARRERRLGPYHRERDALCQRECNQFWNRRQRHVGELGLECGAGIAGRDIDLAHARRLRDFPRQRVLASAAADHKDSQRVTFRRARHWRKNTIRCRGSRRRSRSG